MSSKRLISGAILALSLSSLPLASAWAQAESDDDEDTKELRGYSVGGDMRTGFESDAEIKLEKPDFSRDLKMDAPRPSMSGMNLENSRPKLKVVSPPPGASAGSSQTSSGQQERGGNSSASQPASGQSAGSSAGSAAGSASSPSSRASGQTTEIRPIRMDPPEYPARAMRQRQEGSVTLEFTITEEGSTDDITVVSANPPRLFDRAAIRAVADWKFEPAKFNGVPRAQRIRHTIEFTLN